MRLKDLNYHWLIPATVLVIAAVAGMAAISRVSI
jgi:hypothetical protein